MFYGARQFCIRDLNGYQLSAYKPTRTGLTDGVTTECPFTLMDARTDRLTESKGG